MRITYTQLPGRLSVYHRFEIENVTLTITSFMSFCLFSSHDFLCDLPLCTMFSWGFLNLTGHQSQPEIALNCILYTPALATLPTEFACWYTLDSSSIPSSPHCEPNIQLKPWDDFFLSQLWLPTIIQQANNEPLLWEQSKSNVRSADKVPIRTACLRDNFMREIKRRGRK